MLLKIILRYNTRKELFFQQEKSDAMEITLQNRGSILPASKSKKMFINVDFCNNKIVFPFKNHHDLAQFANLLIIYPWIEHP